MTVVMAMLQGRPLPQTVVIISLITDHQVPPLHDAADPRNFQEYRGSMRLGSILNSVKWYRFIETNAIMFTILSAIKRAKFYLSSAVFGRIGLFVMLLAIQNE